MPSFDLEEALWARGFQHVAGVDEAGRGCLAGPVVAAAVVLPSEVSIEGLDDSKRMAPSRRETAFEQIQEQALAVGVGRCSPAEIDHLNILWAAMEAMRRSVTGCAPTPDYLLIDGNRCFPESPWPFDTVIKGDQHSLSIAAASVVAKVTRDRLMATLHADFPMYDWHSNVGYPTRAHYDALAEHGPTPHHRRSFKLEQT
jgi:ribonuclease HII